MFFSRTLVFHNPIPLQCLFIMIRAHYQRTKLKSGIKRVSNFNVFAEIMEINQVSYFKYKRLGEIVTAVAAHLHGINIYMHFKISTF